MLFHFSARAPASSSVRVCLCKCPRLYGDRVSRLDNYCLYFAVATVEAQSINTGCLVVCFDFTSMHRHSREWKQNKNNALSVGSSSIYKRAPRRLLNCECLLHHQFQCSKRTAPSLGRCSKVRRTNNFEWVASGKTHTQTHAHTQTGGWSDNTPDRIHVKSCRGCTQHAQTFTHTCTDATV